MICIDGCGDDIEVDGDEEEEGDCPGDVGLHRMWTSDVMQDLNQTMGEVVQGFRNT